VFDHGRVRTSLATQPRRQGRAAESPRSPVARGRVPVRKAHQPSRRATPIDVSEFASISRLPRHGGCRERRTRRVDSSQTHVSGKAVVIAGRRLIPDVHAARRWQRIRLLNRRVPHHDVAANPAVGRRGEHDDAVGVADCRVRFDQVVVARKDPDAEIRRRAGRVTVAARLVPPERVIGSLDSYPAARIGGVPVSNRHVPLHADLRGRSIDANPTQAIGCRRHALDPSLDARHEQNSVCLEALHHARSTNADIDLPIQTDASVGSH
jgi:hypothetical protein